MSKQINNQQFKSIFIFLGPPGAGKGSLSDLCLKRYRCVQLSTGNLCRQHIANQTEIGKEIDFAIKSGKLINDSLIISMVDKWLIEQAENDTSIILDGFPRTTTQARTLYNLLQNDIFTNFRLSVVKLEVGDEMLVHRLSSRLVCQSKNCQAVYSLIKDSTLNPLVKQTCNECESILIRRADDEEHAIRQRLTIYHKHEQDLVEFYQSVKQPVNIVNADQPIEQVFSNFVKLIN